MKRALLLAALLIGGSFSAQAQHFYVQRPPGHAASSSALPNPGLPAGVPPAYVNTPPSRAALLQNSYSEAFLERARAAERPSAAARFQDEQFRDRVEHDERPARHGHTQRRR